MIKSSSIPGFEPVAVEDVAPPGLPLPLILLPLTLTPPLPPPLTLSSALPLPLPLPLALASMLASIVAVRKYSPVVFL